MGKKGKTRTSLTFYNNAVYFINEQLQAYGDGKNGLTKGELRFKYLNYNENRCGGT